MLYYDPSVPEDEVLRRIAPEAIITKESGESGGFEAKVEAALALGIRVFAVCRPEMPEGFVTVTGRHGLRRAIERLVPGFLTSAAVSPPEPVPRRPPKVRFRPC